MKKLTSLISCLILLCLIGCNTASGGSGNPDKEQPDSTAGFTIYNFCDTDIIVCVGTIPKQGDKYDWSQQNRFSIMQPKTIKKNEKLIVPVAELQSNQSYLIGANPPNVNSLYWPFDKEYNQAVFTNQNENKELWMYKYKGGKSKIQNTGASDIYPMTIKNNGKTPLVVQLGDVAINNSGFDWDNVNYNSFLDQTLLLPNESITAYGKLSDKKGFYMYARSFSNKGTGGGITNAYNEVIFSESDDNIEFVYKCNPTPNPQETNPDFPEDTLENAFYKILLNNYWIKTNPKSITENDGVYTFDGTSATGGFKRTITLSQATTLTFKTSFNLNYGNGALQFLIDDEVVDTYEGSQTDWQKKVFELKEGTHTLEWKRCNAWYIPPYDSNYYISLKDFAFINVQPINSINQTFNDSLDSNMWIPSGFLSKVLPKDEELERWPQYDDAIVDTHGKIFQLGTFESWENHKYGNSSLTILKIAVTEEFSLSFDYKCDLYQFQNEEQKYANYFGVYIDDETEPAFKATGIAQPWKNGSIILTKGIHSVTFAANLQNPSNPYCSPSITNSVYLDNITLAPNKIESVDIYPKGLQETYVNGDAIQFSAKALRSDGSVIADKSVIWSTNGGTIDNNGLFTPGTTSGDFTVTATIDGKTASNTTVKVHGKNYLNDPVTINGHTFTGQITDGSVGLDPNENITTNIKLDFSASPQFSNFTTNGFFVLKGTATNTDVVVTVRKKMPEDDTSTSVSYKYYTIYKIKAGDFNQRIWLRYGDGEYEILICEVTFDAVNDYDGYECAISNWSSNWDINTREFLTVINKTGLNYSEDDSAYLMPSYICPSDAFVVSNGFNAVMAEMPENASVGQKLKALYDWVINLCHYDYVSLGDDIENPTSDKRKRQEAPYVINYQMAVCEGYANLYTALARLAGVKTAYQSSMQLNHAWTECYYKGEWKMVDATWDDPSDTTVTVSIPNAGNYNYFLIDRKDSSHAGNDGSLDNVTDYSRHADTSSGSNYLSDMRY